MASTGWQRWRVGIVVAVVAAGAGLQLVATMRRVSPAGHLPAQESAVQVKESDLEVTVFAAGRVQFRDPVPVRAEGSGILRQLHVATWDTVSAGQELGVLEDPEEGFVRREAELELERVALDRESLARKKEELQVRAPLSGTITELLAEPGRDVQPGDVLARIRSSHLEVRVAVTKAVLPHAQVGKTVDVWLPEFLFSVKGTIREVDRAGRPAGAGAILHDVIVQVENPGGIPPDTVAEVRFDGFPASQPGKLALKQEDVKAPRAGKLDSWHVAQGDAVEKGQVLAALVDAGLEEEERALALREEQARLALARQDAARARRKVVAPVGGVVTRVPVQPGESVSPGTIVAEIAVGKPQVLLTVTERDVPRVRAGEPVRLQVDAFPQQTFTGLVREVGAEGKGAGGNTDFEVWVEVGPDTPPLRPGMSATADIVVEERRRVLVVPATALQDDGGRTYVWVVPAAGSGDPQRRQVQVGLRSENSVEIVSGLRVGEMVLEQPPEEAGGRESGQG